MKKPKPDQKQRLSLEYHEDTETGDVRLVQKEVQPKPDQKSIDARDAHALARYAIAQALALYTSWEDSWDAEAVASRLPPRIKAIVRRQLGIERKKEKK